jgi:hypothetical protein
MRNAQGIGVPPASGRDRLRRAPLLLLALFLLLLVIGIAVDEPTRVLEQAKSVCLSCIGIG